MASTYCVWNESTFIYLTARHAHFFNLEEFTTLKLPVYSTFKPLLAWYFGHYVKYSNFLDLLLSAE